jgi:hypothetical protein
MDIVATLTSCVQNNVSCSFSKYGDGEYYCVIKNIGCNCDNDNFSEKKTTGLINAFKYVTSKGENHFVGMWHDQNIVKFWNQYDDVNNVQWADYHTFLIDRKNTNIYEKVLLYKAIKQSSLKKIYVCNPLLGKAKGLLNIDTIINVPFNNWFDTLFDTVFKDIEEQLEPGKQHIIMTSAGMGAKVLIYELMKKYPNNLYFDLGSALDQLCTKKTSRGWEPSYEHQLYIFKDLLPSDWNDEKYNDIYKEAVTKLGIHLR